MATSPPANPIAIATTVYKAVLGAPASPYSSGAGAGLISTAGVTSPPRTPVKSSSSSSQSNASSPSSPNVISPPSSPPPGTDGAASHTRSYVSAKTMRDLGAGLGEVVALVFKPVSKSHSIAITSLWPAPRIAGSTIHVDPQAVLNLGLESGSQTTTTGALYLIPLNWIPRLGDLAAAASDSPAGQTLSWMTSLFPASHQVCNAGSVTVSRVKESSPAAPWSTSDIAGDAMVRAFLKHVLRGAHLLASQTVLVSVYGHPTAWTVSAAGPASSTLAQVFQVTPDSTIFIEDGSSTGEGRGNDPLSHGSSSSSSSRAQGNASGSHGQGRSGAHGGSNNLPTREPDAPPTHPVSYEDIGGAEKAIEAVKEYVELPLLCPGAFRALGISPPRGVLIYGAPGTGKSMLAAAAGAAAEAAIFTVAGPELSSKFMGEAEAALRGVFASASAVEGPALIVLEELDAVAPRRDGGEDGGVRTAAALGTLMDGLRDGVVVIGCTNRPGAVDPGLRRPGRFDREVETGTPGEADRLAILKVLVKGVTAACTEDDLLAVAAATGGCVGADLSSVVREGALAAMKRAVGGGKLLDAVRAAGGAVPEAISAASVTGEDLREAAGRVRPSGLREVAVEVPKVSWNDIGGQAGVKVALRQAVEWPLVHREAFLRFGVAPPRGVLLYGPPGCSKTLMAKAVASQSGLNFISIKGSEVFSKWVGESERTVRSVFRRARAASPCVVFFDEIDAVGGKRASGSHDGGDGGAADRVLAALLTELDGVEGAAEVIVLGATNRPAALDPALTRPGRLDRLLYVPPPTEPERAEIAAIHGRKVPLAYGVTAERIASVTAGYTGAEVASVVREAALAAMAEDVESAKEVQWKHVEAAVAGVRPQVTPQMLSEFAAFAQIGGPGATKAFAPKFDLPDVDGPFDFGPAK